MEAQGSMHLSLFLMLSPCENIFSILLMRSIMILFVCLFVWVSFLVQKTIKLDHNVLGFYFSFFVLIPFLTCLFLISQPGCMQKYHTQTFHMSYLCDTFFCPLLVKSVTLMCVIHNRRILLICLYHTGFHDDLKEAK